MCKRRRKVQGAGEDDVEIPSAANTALTWAFFMGTSANIRYQVLHSLSMENRPAAMCMDLCVTRGGMTQQRRAMGACMKAVACQSLDTL